MKIKEINSPSNESFKQSLQLTSSSGIKKNKKIFISGLKIISEFLSEKKVTPCEWWLTEDHLSNELVLKYNFPIFKLSKLLFNQLDALGTQGPLLKVDLPEFTQFEPNEQSAEGLTLVLATQDPQNLGAIVRSAVGFGVKKTILLKEAANPYLPKSIKASSGAVFSMSFMTGESINSFCAKPTYALDKNGTPIKEILKKLPSNLFLLAGEEGKGLPSKNKFDKVSIPCGNIESLNVGVATSIFLYEYFCHRGIHG